MSNSIKLPTDKRPGEKYGNPGTERDRISGIFISHTNYGGLHLDLGAWGVSAFYCMSGLFMTQTTVLDSERVRYTLLFMPTTAALVWLTA